MNKYHIGDLGFRTQADAINYTRKMIESIGCGKITQTHENYQFFNDLIQNHNEPDEKIGCGIAYFEICNNKITPKNYHIMNIIRTDKTVIDFSWKNCAKGKKNTGNNNSEYLKEAMREYITQNWLKYHSKNANLQILCASCNLKKPRK